MILAAALLVLLGLGLFVGGILTGTTLLYWACVVACVAAGVFLMLARVRMGRAAAPTGSRPSGPARHQLPATTGGGTAVGATAVSALPTAEPARDDDRAPAESGEVRSVTAPSDAPVGERPAGPAREPGGAPAVAPGEEERDVAAPVRYGRLEPPAAAPGEEERDVPGPVRYGRLEPPSTAAHAPRGTSGPQDLAGDPPVEEVEVTDLLVVVDLRDEVLVVDEHPRYHLGSCRWLAGRETIPLPVDEARTDGFTPCAWCAPDRTLAQRERGRR